MLVLHNARIRTLNPDQPFASALACEDGRIRMVGSDTEVLAEFGSKSRVMDMGGRVIWPGLTDAHIHLEMYAFSHQRVDCETNSRAECLRRVSARARQAPPGAWILGQGWNQNNWTEGFGHALDLDAVSLDHPVYLFAKSAHAAWANTAAMRAAGITSATDDPVGGKIGRDPSGAPNGLFFETAMDLVIPAIPSPTPEETTRAIDQAQARLWRMGITAVHDFDRRGCFRALQTLEQNQRLHLRVVKSIPLEDLSHAIGLGLQTGFGNDLLRIGSVKLFADGALGPKTAAMLQPYENDEQNSGILLLDNEQIFEYGRQASLAGISVAIHAIGDRANHEALTAYAQLREYEQGHKTPPLRHRIEHVQILHPADYDQLARSGIIASVQPIHATSDMYMADQHWGSRSKGAYAYKTLIKRHTAYCFGSDAPIETPNPFIGLHAAITRRRVDGSPAKEGWYPDQRLSLAEALAGYTTGPAYAAGWERQQGRLAPGFFADMIILENDPFAAPVDSLHQINPLATLVGGEWVWADMEIESL